jgi:preprotein translocase subunit Sec63
MTDYFTVFLSGFATGLGVIVAQRAYKWWEKIQDTNKHILKNIFLGEEK